MFGDPLGDVGILMEKGRKLLAEITRDGEMETTLEQHHYASNLLQDLLKERRRVKNFCRAYDMLLENMKRVLDLPIKPYQTDVDRFYRGSVRR